MAANLRRGDKKKAAGAARTYVQRKRKQSPKKSHSRFCKKKSTRSMSSSERFEKLFQEVQGAKWDVMLVSGTWRPNKEIWESDHGHVVMESGDEEILVLIHERKTIKTDEKERIRDVSKKIKKMHQRKKDDGKTRKNQKIFEEFRGTKNISNVNSAKKRILIPNVGSGVYRCTSRQYISRTE